MKKRVLIIVLVLCMAISLLPVTTLAGETPFTSNMTAMMSPTTNGAGDIWLFACATAITIEAKGSGSVIMADNNGTATEIDLAEVTKDLMNGENSSALVNNGENGYDLSNVVIFGGKGSGSVYRGTTSITMNGGTVGALVGGNRGLSIIGNTNITINGGTLKGAYLVNGKNPIHFVGGGLGQYGKVLYDIETPSVVSGEATVTINGGSFDTRFENFIFAYAGGCSTGSYNSVCSANLYINGGDLSKLVAFYSSLGSEFTENDGYSDNTGNAPGFYVYCNVSGLSGKIRTADWDLGNNHASYITTSDEGALSTNADKSHLIVIDHANKTYTFGTGVTEACLFADDHTIPAGYKLEIPAGVTLTIPKNVTITNEGSIVIKGTLTNNGTISGSGSIVKVGSGAYTGGTPAADTIPSVVESFATLTFAPGANRGTTKLTDIDAVGDGNTQYYKYVYSTSGEPAPPMAGATFANDGYSPIPTADTEIAVAKNGGYIIAVEVDCENTIVKYSCTEMTEATIGSEADYDSLEASIISGGDGVNTTKITAAAESGNTLYYGITASAVGTNYAYNTPIDVSGLSVVSSGTDISTTLGKYLSIYEVDSSTNLLRKFRCAEITLSYFTGYTGGLVADTVNKIIYCDGKTVCMSAEYYSNYGDSVSAPRLYVLENGVWEQAIPKNLPFSEGFGFNDYTLSGKANAEDSSEAKGTVYILSSSLKFDSNTFYSALPKGTADFANFIIPNLSEKGSDGWQLNYTVGGTINPLDSRQDHLRPTSEFKILEMASLTLQDGATFTVPTASDGVSISNDLHVYFYGDPSTDIIRGSGASTQNIHNMVYTPMVDVKLLRDDGTEFSKDDSGKYLVPRDTQVTIVASVGVYGSSASISNLPGVYDGAPDNISVYYTNSPTLAKYTLGFRKRVGEDYNYSCYTTDKLSISYSGSSDESRLTTLALTLANINDYEGYELFVSNSDIQTELDGAAHVPPQLLDSFHFLSYTLTKKEQESITSSMPLSADYGTSGLNVGASGGSGTGAFSYSSSNTGVTTVDASGNITIVGAGSTVISVTKAGDTEYESRTDTFTLAVNKKVPTASELTLTPAADLVYNGSEKLATVMEAAGVSGLGSVTPIYYEGKGSTTYAKSTGAPTNAGTYEVSVDLAAGDNYTSISDLLVGEFTITKSISFPAPTSVSIDDLANTFTFTPVSGYTDYQFSLDQEATWADCVDTDSSSDTITISVGNIAGEVFVRIKETENYVGASLSSDSFAASLEGSVTITGTARYGQTLTANVTGAQSNAVFSYVWKAAGTQIASTSVSTLTLTMDGIIGKTITVEVSASPYAGTLTSIETASVGKGIPTGTPSYDAITTSGKTLADAALTIGSLEPSTTGYTLKWMDDMGVELTGTTEVKANTAYKWSFTPKDTANYDTLSGSITLYSVSTGGSGGGAATEKSTAPVSTGKGNIEVEVTAKDGTAIIGITDTQIKEIVSGTESAGTVKIDVSGLTVDAAVLPSTLVSAVGAASGSTGLAVTLPAGTVTLDKAALEAVSGKGDITLSVETVDNSKLSEAQKTALGNQASIALAVDVNLYAGGTKTSTFGGGKISVSVPYTPISGESTDSITVWFVKDDGTIEPKSGTYNASTGCVEFTTEHLSQYLIVSFPFADVAEEAWYYGSVAYAYNNGLYAGTSSTTFSPDTAMTRQMIWIVLARMDGNKPASMDEARVWAMEKGISDGSNPTDTITREQMATILYRYAQFKKYDTTQGGNTIREFADYDSTSEYALPALGWSVNAGLIQGSDNSLQPKGNATRAQVAAILERFCKNIVQ